MGTDRIWKPWALHLVHKYTQQAETERCGGSATAALFHRFAQVPKTHPVDDALRKWRRCRLLYLAFSGGMARICYPRTLGYPRLSVP